MSLRGDRVQLIDCDYHLPQFAGAYLLQGGGEAAFVETNTAHAVPRMLEVLARAGGSPEDIRYILVTHAHLDHSGGASALMKACPRATLLTHPRAARHLIDPAKLIAGAQRVYGEKVFSELYGKIEPIPADRVRSMEDGSEVDFGGGRLRFLHTRGHANHHTVVQDVQGGGIFTGDAFGLGYPALQSKGLFVFPSTSPTDFDGPAARESVSRIVSSGATHAWLTHFGKVANLQAAGAQLIEELERSEDVLARAVKSSLADSELDSWCESELVPAMRARMDRHGLSHDALFEGHRLWKFVEFDLKLNGAGLGHVARMIRSGKTHAQLR